nr:transketolase [Saprospiraceae bacterium]
HSAGRQMTSHFSSRWLDENGNWLNQTEMNNWSSDVAPTASQMGRAVGLALASKTYRSAGKHLAHMTKFSNEGNEVTFATIGDASTSEGIFFEAVNAAGVQQIPLVISVWDDDYGISVSKDLQTTKSSISEALAGFEANENHSGYSIFKVRGWDYPALIQTYKEAAHKARTNHQPVLVHVVELTQPQGHSTSGSHERYKSEERLAWEKDHDCLKKLQEWILTKELATEEELEEIRTSAEVKAKEAMKKAWKNFLEPIEEDKRAFLDIIKPLVSNDTVAELVKQVENDLNIRRATIDEVGRQALIALRHTDSESKVELTKWLVNYKQANMERHNSFLFTNTAASPLNIKAIPPQYDNASVVNGFEVLQHCFRANFKQYPELVAFGEDLGKIGGVNQGFAGLQEEFGVERIFDTGIRENTIMGQGIGMAMRGLRPIAEIQYLDYLLYGLQQLSDELATLSYRTKGGQKAPMIIRTRGHRLEGIWHTGSPVGLMLGSLRGVHVLVPRNMTQAAGFYNTLLAGDEPGIVIEPLNAYRFKEHLPSNIGAFRVPLGKVETVRSGTDITVVTYGSCVRVVNEASKQLEKLGISLEVIDVQSLLPFDLEHDIVKSLQKTSRVLFVDEDVPGGATSFMMQQVLEVQSGYKYLDAQPITLTASAHRSGYGSEYNHFTKPMPIDIVEAAYQLMHEANPVAFPKL